MLTDAIVEVAQCSGASTRIFEILQTRDAQIKDKYLMESLLDRSQMCYAKGKRDISEFDGTLTFRDVSFRYHAADRIVLNRINFHVDSGSMAALVGSSGGGKTTIVSLIEGFYQPTSGEILIGGKSTKDIDMPWMHANLVTIVSQEPSLFAGTSKLNL